MSEEQEKKPDTFAICKVCQKTKVRNPAGKFPNGRDTKFVDERDRTWNGKKCSECVRSHMGKHMKAKRNKDIQ